MAVNLSNVLNNPSGAVGQISQPVAAQPVNGTRVDDNLGTFAGTILNTKNEINNAIQHPNSAETFLTTIANKNLAQDAVTALNLAFRALKGYFPPVLEPQADANAAIAHPTMLYGLFMFNRVNDALNQIKQEIATMQAAVKSGAVAAGDKLKVDTAIHDLQKAQNELTKIHSKLSQFAPAA